LLFEYETAWRDREIEWRAQRIWATHDAAALQAEYDSRWDDQGFPQFSFDLSALPEPGEPWAAAWQLAIGDVERNPPPYPVYTSEEVGAWVETMGRANRLMGKGRSTPRPQALALA
jgi:hypothetical protein